MEVKKIRKRYISIILLILFLTLSAVSAEDLNITDSVLEINDQSSEIVADSDEATFSELQELINDESKSEIVLDKDYKFNPESDSAYTDGVKISRPVTIVGNNHILNGNNQARIFNIASSNVILDGITFINANSDKGSAVLTDFSKNNVHIKNSNFENCAATGDGGAVYVMSQRSSVENCTFIGNVAEEGGGLSASGNYFKLSDSRFLNNRATGEDSAGGGFALLAYDSEIENCIFSNNSAYSGGGVYVASDGIYITNITCKDNTAMEGGAMFLYSEECEIEDSDFYNNTGHYGGAFHLTSDSADVVIRDSNIFNNTGFAGGAFYVGSEDLELENVKIVNNTATYVGAIYYTEAVTIDDDTVIENNTPSKSQVANIKETEAAFDVVVTHGRSHEHVLLDDGYYGFCINKRLSPPLMGTIYDTGSMSLIVNTLDNSYVGEYLKILIIEYEDKVNNNKRMQNLIWTFTDGKYLESTDPIIQDVINDYNNGLKFPNDNATYRYNETHILDYDFKTYHSTDYKVQNLFAHKREFKEIHPELVVEKKTLNKTVFVGEKVIFEITVKNTGNIILDNVSVFESYFDGLEYESLKDSTGRWVKRADSLIWDYNYTFNPGDVSSFFVVFKTTGVGNFTNVVIASSNETDNATSNNTTTVKNNITDENTTNITNSSNSTPVDNKTVPHENIVNNVDSDNTVPQNNRTNTKTNVTTAQYKENTTSTSDTHYEYPVSKNITANPLALLIVSLLIAGVSNRRKP